MNSALWRTLLCLLLLTLPVACGDDKKDSSSGGGTTPAANGDFTPPKPSSVSGSTLPAEIASLLPQDAVLVLYTPSADELTNQLMPLMNATGQNDFDPFEPFAALPGAGHLVEQGVVPRDQPLTMAVSISMGGGMPAPIITVAVPIKSEDEARAALSSLPDFGLPQPVFGGGYASFSSMATGSPRGLKAPAMPGGALSVHVDLGTVVQQMRPFIDMGLGMMQAAAAQQGAGLDAAASQQMAATMVTMARQFLDSSDTLSLGVSGDDKNYAVNLSYQTKAGSPLAKMASGEGYDLFKVAGACDLDQPIAAVLGGDAQQLFEWGKPFWSASMSMYPADVGEKFTAWMDSFVPMMKNFDGTFALSGGMGSGGVQFAQFAGVEKGSNLLEEYLDALEKNPLAGSGISFDKPSKSKVSGHDLYQVAASYDMSKLMADTPPDVAAESQRIMDAIYGKDGMTMRFSEFDQRFGFWLGPPSGGIESSMKLASRSPNELPAEFQEAIARVSGAPVSFASRLELTQFLRELGGMVETMTGEPQDTSALNSVGKIPVYSWGKGEKGTFSFGASIPASSLQSLYNLMQAAESFAPSGMGGF